jgi:hypothetical protein
LKRVCYFAISCAVAAAPLLAHDFYILPEKFIVLPKAKIEVSFQNGDSFPESEAAPVLSRLQDAELQTPDVMMRVQGLIVAGNRVVGAVEIPNGRGSLILSARTTPNFIELAPDKALEYFKEEGLDEVIKWRTKHGEASKPSRERYSKFAKALLLSGAPGNYYKHPLGFPIEIIPETDPYAIHPEGSLPVQVIFRGKPAIGLQLEAAWAEAGRSETKVVGRTDSDGHIRVPISAAGRWRLHALKMERCADAAVADWESYWASLTFEIR